MFRMLLASVLGAAILFVQTKSDSAELDTCTPHVRPDSKITVVYISAWNCPPCFAWYNRHMARIEASREWRHIKWRQVAAYTYRDTAYDSRWPQDLKWVRDTLKIKSGAPRWAVVVDDRAVWYSAWTKRSRWRKTWEIVQSCVAAKLSHGNPSPTDRAK